MKKIFEFILFTVACLYVAIYFGYTKEVDTIKLGQTCPLSGSSSALGIEMMRGANSYFEYINAHGGINGKKIKLITRDDKYEPNIAEQNANELIKKDGVCALFANVGTPTAKYTLPLAIDANIPFIAPFTGAKFLREPFNPLVINLRASYQKEISAIVDYLIRDKKIKKIAIFYQNDNFGTEGVYSVKEALNPYRLKAVCSSSYNRNTLSVKNAIYEISSQKPDAVIIIAPYEPCAEFIKKARKDIKLESAIFCAISFSNSKKLEKELGDNMKNVVVSQVLPDPETSDKESIRLYRELYKKMYPNAEFSYVSLEGFLSAMLTSKAIEKTKKLDAKSIIKAFENLPSNTLGGFHIYISDTNHQALNEIFIKDYNKK